LSDKSTGLSELLPEEVKRMMEESTLIQNGKSQKNPQFKQITSKLFSVVEILSLIKNIYKVNSKAISVTVRGGL
jgi:hypothetical protein